MHLKQDLNELTDALKWKWPFVDKLVVADIVNETALLLLHKMKVRMRLERKGMREDRQDFTEFDSE